MNVPSVLLWGFVATLVLTGMLSGAQGLGLSRMSITYMLGTLFTAEHDKAVVFGFLIHVVNGWLFASLYALGFESLGQATWWLGALGGLVHVLVVLVSLMPLLPGMHPRMASQRHGPTPTKLLQPPGFLALHYGRQTPIVSVVAHVAYGAILGGFYTLAG